MRRLHFYYTILLLCSPLLLKAQLPAAPPDSPGEVVIADTSYKAAEDSAYMEEESYESDSDTDTIVTPPHYLWDQLLPVNADTIEDFTSNRLILRKVPGTLMDELRADKDMQYKRKKQEPSNLGWLLDAYLAIIELVRLFHRVIFLVFLCILIGISLAYLKRNGYIFRGKGEDVTVDLKSQEEDLDPTVYEQQINAAIADGKYRLAVRLLYLQTLRLLSDKGVITYSREKTNAAYLRGMISTPWYKAFAGLTLDYEYIWYGEVPVNNEQFKTIHRQFSQFMNELGYTR